MKFGFIAKHRGIWPVSWLCGALDVSRSGFHAWLVRAPSARSHSDEVYAGKIRASFISSYRTYGARRVWHDLLAEGLVCGLHRVERLMRVHGLMERLRRRGLPKDHGERSVIAGNVLDRQFSADAPNQNLDRRRMAIRGRGDRSVLAAGGRLVDERHDDGAARDRCAGHGDLAARQAHSDQGSQYTSEQFQRVMADNGVTCSMSRSGNVWDNAAMESFFSSLKTERIARKTYRTRNQARQDVFDYIECFYNPTRRHSTLGYLSPMDFEKQAIVA